MISPDRFPVSVILERRPPGPSVWATEQWEAVGVIPGDQETAGTARSLIRSDERGEQFLWTGFVLELYKDEAESYYSNLRGGTPSVFVVCRPAEDNPEMTPLLATVSYDEASAHLEVEDPVFSVSMPAEIYLWLERYVVENYVPTERKKRKRKKWGTEEQLDQS